MKSAIKYDGPAPGRDPKGGASEQNIKGPASAPAQEWEDYCGRINRNLRKITKKKVVGAPRFELGTSRSRTERATRLRHAPNSQRTVASDQGKAGAATHSVSSLATHYLSNNFWSGRPDLNRRPLAPQASALPGCATSRKSAHSRSNIG